MSNRIDDLVKPTVVVVDRDPLSMKNLLRRGESDDLPVTLLLVRFQRHFPSLVGSIMNHAPSAIVLGSGFGMEPNIGEQFVSELKAAGFSGRTVVCCRDTYMVLPLSDDVVRVDPNSGLDRRTLAELVA